MAIEPIVQKVLAEYPPNCRAVEIHALGSAGGFSGARFWQVTTPAGCLCLRQWPKEYPPVERLEFIQAVLWHVVREGIDFVPLPIPAHSQKGYVPEGGYLWELAPWMPGEADFRQDPRPRKLRAAMTALAAFHRATASFPLPNPPESASPGVHDRLERLRAWMSGDLAELARAVEPGDWPQLQTRATRLLELIPRAAGAVFDRLESARHQRVTLQPCIRDVWHDHILYQDDRVTGLIDFGSMAAESVAADIARLLGSMVDDDPLGWNAGIESYCALRPLSEPELALMRAFDQSSVLMSGLTWLDWVYRRNRQFDDRAVILSRLDNILRRLEYLA